VVCRNEVLDFLVHKQLLSPEWADRLLSWRHYVVVGKIIDRLKLTFFADKPPPPQPAYQEYLMAAESSAEYFS